METMKWDAETMDALRVVLSYLEDEQRDFEETGQPEGHIYRNIQRIRKWLDSGAQVLNDGGPHGKK